MQNILDLGCGKWPQKDANIRVDATIYPHITHVHNLCNFPYPFRSSFAHKIYLYDVIEHISIFQVNSLIQECYRILIPGGTFDITCPDVKWISQRIVCGDWKERAKGTWLNKYPTDFQNAMSYMFGGFYAMEEWNKPGLGHVAGYDENTLIETLRNAIGNSWRQISKVPDPRNECILRVVAIK